MKTAMMGLLAGMILVACTPRLSNPNYDYGYVTSLSAHASRSELPGELFVLERKGDAFALFKADGRVNIPENILESTGVTSGGSNEIRGASADVIQFGENTISGRLKFEATITATNAFISRVDASRISDLVEALYASKASEEFAVGEEPLSARRVVEDKDVFYAVVAGVGQAELFELSHGAPSGVTNGFSASVAGREFTNLNISSDSKWTCRSVSTTGADAGSCMIVVEVLDAAWTVRDGQTRLNVFPARERIDRSQLAEAFRALN